MPFGLCSECDHCYILHVAPSPQWTCPCCYQPLREIPREEALTRLRHHGDRPQPGVAPAHPAAGKPPGARRTTVSTQRSAPKANGNVACLPGPAPSAFVEIKHRETGQVLCWVAGDTLAGADLSRAELTHADLRGADLHRAILTEALLCGANLTAADLSEARLERAMLLGAQLTGADLRGAVLGGAALHGCDLTGTLLDQPFTGVPLSDDQTRWPDGFVLGVPAPTNRGVAPHSLCQAVGTKNPERTSQKPSAKAHPHSSAEPISHSEITLFVWGYAPPQSRLVRDLAEPTEAARSLAVAAGWDECQHGAWAKELRVSGLLSAALQELIPIVNGDPAVVGWRLGSGRAV